MVSSLQVLRLNICGFISYVMRATFLAHLVLDTTNCAFRPSRHGLMVSRPSGIKMVVISSTGRIVFDLCPFENETLTVCRNVCNHLPSNVASYSRIKVGIICIAVKTYKLA